MPKVGKMEFPYSKKGMAMAKKAAKKSGKKMTMKKMGKKKGMNKKLTAQQKAERGRAKERKIAKMDPISRSTVRGKGSVPVPSKNKKPRKYVE